MWLPAPGVGGGVSSLAQTAPPPRAGEEAGLLRGGGPPGERLGTSQEFGQRPARPMRGRLALPRVLPVGIPADLNNGPGIPGPRSEPGPFGRLVLQKEPLESPGPAEGSESWPSPGPVGACAAPQNSAAWGANG